MNRRGILGALAGIAPGSVSAFDAPFEAMRAPQAAAEDAPQEALARLEAEVAALRSEARALGFGTCAIERAYEAAVSRLRVSSDVRTLERCGGNESAHAETSASSASRSAAVMRESMPAMTFLISPSSAQAVFSLPSITCCQVSTDSSMPGGSDTSMAEGGAGRQRLAPL
jgi:hypothetical protein